jgi:hypothetical protein
VVSSSATVTEDSGEELCSSREVEAAVVPQAVRVRNKPARIRAVFLFIVVSFLDYSLR